jgi:uncharacterized membrane protein YfcA
VTYLAVCLVALIASALTLFSGFGLGTLLLPAFALVFPVEIAVAATAVVHLTNNLFKLVLVGRDAKAGVVLALGVPAIPAAFGGAWLLGALAAVPELARYTLAGLEARVTVVKLALALLIAVFAALELSPASERWTFAPRWLPLGGVIMGFFGGLSGHQGALRSAFLLRHGLSKRAFIGTGVVCAVLVDLVRLSVYGRALPPLGREQVPLLVSATLAAVTGAWIGVRLLGKVTLTFVRRLVGGLLLVLAAGLACGVV